MHPALDLRDVVKRFGNRAVLDRLSLQVSAGEYVTILGPSGSGKSTLLRVIAGFEPPEDGEVRIGGLPVLGQPPHRRGVGFVFQSFALFPHLTVADNVAFGLRNRRAGTASELPPSPAQVERRVTETLELVGLHGLGARLPAQISGGQKQRVAFARTLIAEPRLVLLDEPLGALDAQLRGRMMSELRRIHGHLGATFLHVTGSEAEALAMGTRVAVLSKGRIGQIAEPETLLDAPASGEVARLLNCYNVLPGRVENGAFAARGFRLPLAGAAPGAGSGPASYCVRTDRVGVADTAADASDEVGLTGRFLAGEYSGARVTGLFDIGAERPFEVEYYLGHRRPPEFERDRSYALRWPAASALVFADA